MAPKKSKNDLFRYKIIRLLSSFLSQVIYVNKIDNNIPMCIGKENKANDNLLFICHNEYFATINIRNMLITIETHHITLIV
jgi:hypothetical protein